MTTLAALPTDALATITSFLGAEDIAYLCFTGDSALKLHLRHGGVVSLVLEAPIAFPRIVGQLRLRSFSIIPYSKDRYNECPTYGIDLSLLGPQLEDLCLDFNSALAKLDQLNVPLGTLFPNLKSLFLPIQPRMPTDLDVGRLLQGLPSTLLHLSLPRCAAVDIEALLSLPCHLESLEVRLGRIGDGQDRVFAESKIFDRLTKLHVTTDKKVQCFRIIPSSVLDFSWTADSAATMAPIIADDFAFIPAGLQSLFICPFLNEYLPLLQHLPRDLKYLGILSYEDLTEVNFVKTLPPSLTRLETSSVASNILAKLVSLPPRLEIWRQFRLRKEQMELKLPPNLTELCITNLDAQDFAALLPTSLRSLTVSNNSLLQDETRFTALLPSTLTKLHLVVKACSAASLRHLPPSLRKFYLKLKDFTLPSNFVDDEWKTIWPDSLERLRFLATCEVDSLGPLFWLSLPRRLRQLEIYIPDYSHMPPTMAFLPRTLIRCDFAVFFHEGMTPVVLEDSFFTELPSTLRYLRLEAFICNLTPSFMLNLPKRLLTLDMYPFTSNTTGLSRPVSCSFNLSEERMSELWDFLDKTPPCLTIRTSDPEPDFVQWHNKRRVDDFCEDCPNVAFSPHAAGIGRPNSTPRRKRK